MTEKDIEQPKLEGNYYHTEKTPEDGIFMFPWLRQNIDDLKHAVLYQDWDGVLIVDGMEGSGKSTLAQQIGGYLNPEMDLSHVVFTIDQFQQKIERATKGDVIIWDETDFSSKKWMRKKQQAIQRKLQLIRDKNLFLIFVVPYIFQLEKYLAISRSRALIHVVAQGFKRGFYEFYGYQSKKKLYFKGKRKYWTYSVESHDWPNQGRFNSGYYIRQDNYKKKKRQARKGDDEESQWTRNNMIKKLAKAQFTGGFNKQPITPTREEIANFFNLSKRQIYKILKN